LPPAYPGCGILVSSPCPVHVCIFPWGNVFPRAQGRLVVRRGDSTQTPSPTVRHYHALTHKTKSYAVLSAQPTKTCHCHRHAPLKDFTFTHCLNTQDISAMLATGHCHSVASFSLFPPCTDTHSGNIHSSFQTHWGRWNQAGAISPHWVPGFALFHSVPHHDTHTSHTAPSQPVSDVIIQSLHTTHSDAGGRQVSTCLSWNVWGVLSQPSQGSEHHRPGLPPGLLPSPSPCSPQGEA
jgi:hypothetical protein